MNEEFFITQIIDFVNEKLKENQTEKAINEFEGEELIDTDEKLEME